MNLNKFKFLFLFLLYAALLGCSDNTVSDAVDSSYIVPKKSPNDRREYRSFVLENQMQILVISDSQTKTSAASVDVNSGYNSDPEEFEGLAHFLEHMLFLGTEKYPQSGEYQEYISSHGGSHNAYTAYENTNYYFNIEAEYLEPALDRFSQFFVAPLFNPDYVDREKNAVNSEYQSNLQSDARRSNSVWKQVINQSHPMSQFSTGNLTTLTDKEGMTLQQALLQHYEENYSANMMTLAVLGRESLDELEAMVRSYFSEVNNNNVESPSTDEPLLLSNELPALLEYEPFRDSRSLSYTFPIPIIKDRYKSKPAAYLGNLIGHEGEGSLLSLLKKQGWANALSAGAGFSNDENATFSITILLTESGLTKVDEISQLLFQYIELVKQEGLQERIFKEQQKMAELSFLFQEPARPISLVSSLSRSMQEYPPEELITAPYAFEEFDPNFLQQILVALNPNNVLLTLTSQQIETQERDPWYDAGYAYTALSDEQTASWSTETIDSALRIPDPNPFLPEDISLKASEYRDLAELSLEEIVSKPELILQEEGVRLWFAQDTIYQQARASFYLYAMSPIFNESLENVLLSGFVVSLLNDKLNEYSYPANLAGVFYRVTRHARGFSLNLGGYNDKQSVLLNEVLETFKQAEFSQDRFEIIKAEMIRGLENADLQNPYVHAYSEVQNLMTNPYWSNEERLVMLDEISFEDVMEFVPLMMKGLRVDALYHGNGEQADALTLVSEVRKYLQTSDEIDLPDFGTVVDMSESIRVVQELGVEHDDSAVVLYFQAPDDELQTRATLSVLGSIIRSPFFDVLRTEQQLGYVVNAGAMSILDVSALVMYIQSPIADPVTLESRINDFIESYAEDLAQMPQETFDSSKAGLLNTLTEKPQRMNNLGSRFWNDIVEQKLGMDSRLELAQAISTVSMEDVMNYYQEHISNMDAARLVARSFGRNHQDQYNEARNSYAPTTIVVEENSESYQAFKASQDVFTFNPE